MARLQPIITGDKELSLRLLEFERKVQRRMVRQATRRAMKEVVLPEAKRNIIDTSYDTGSWHDSLAVRAVKRSRRQIGATVVTREPKDNLFYEDTWYFKFPELGSKHQPAAAPMRRALYETINESRGVFQSYMRIAINEA